MDNNARVRIQVDDSKIRALKQSAAELYNKLSEQAKAQARDLRDANRYIEEQIRLIERRNEAATRSRRAEIEYDKRTGRLVGRSYEAAVRGIDQRTFADQERVRALRGLMDIEFGPRTRAMEQFGDISRAAALGGGNVSGGIEEGIRRREIASRRAFAMQENQLRSRYEQGYLTRDQYGRGLRDLRAEQRQDALLVKLLREIADNTKNDARKSAEELVKRLGVRSREDATRWIADLEGKRTGTATDIMRRQEAASILRQTFNIGGGAGGRGINLGGVLTSGAGMLAGQGGALGGMLTKFGPAGLAIGAMIGGGMWGFDRYSTQAAQARDLAVYHGMSLRQARDMVSGWDKTAMGLGLSTEQLSARMAGFEKASGRWYTSNQAMNMIAQQRALGLSDDQYTQMLRLGRQTRGGSIPGLIDVFANQVKRQYGGLTRLPDALEYFTSAAQSVLNVKGDVNQNALAGIISSLMAGGVQGSQMNRVLGGIQNIGTNKNPLAQGLAYRAMSMVNPNASTWDLTRLLESPLENIPFLRAYFKQAREISGGDVTQEKFLLKGVTGLSANDVEKLYSTLLTGTDKDINRKISSIKTGYGGGEGNLPRATDLTTSMEQLTASIDKMKDELVEKLIKIADNSFASDKAQAAYRKMMDPNAPWVERIVAGILWSAGSIPLSPAGYGANWISGQLYNNNQANESK